MARTHTWQSCRLCFDEHCGRSFFVAALRNLAAEKKGIGPSHLIGDLITGLCPCKLYDILEFIFLYVSLKIAVQGTISHNAEMDIRPRLRNSFNCSDGVSMPLLRNEASDSQEPPNGPVRRTIWKLVEVTTEMYDVSFAIKTKSPSILFHVSRKENSSVRCRPEHVSIFLSPKRALYELRQIIPVERNNERNVQRRRYRSKPDSFLSEVCMQHVRTQLPNLLLQTRSENGPHRRFSFPCPQHSSDPFEENPGMEETRPRDYVNIIEGIHLFVFPLRRDDVYVNPTFS
jgi:hypothetical protein